MNVVADALLVSKTLQTLTATKVEKFLPAEMVDSNMLGFENPYIKLSLHGNKRRNTLILGNALTDPNNKKTYYAKLENNPTIFTVRGDQYDQFIQAHKELREKNFVTLNKESISTIDILNFDNDTKLQKLENDEWQVLSLNENTPTKPFQADREVIKDFITNLDTLRASDFFADNPSVEDLNALNFNQPILQILVYSHEDNILSLNAVQHPDSEAFLLAKIKNDPTIYIIDKASFIKNFSAEPLSYRNRSIEKFPDVSRIQKLEIIDIINNEVLLNYPSEIKEDITVTKLLASLKEFKVSRYVDKNTIKQTNNITEINWNYRLSFDVLLPGDTENKVENRIYYFNKRASGNLQLGSTHDKSLLFELSQNLMQALHPFVNSFEFTPESINEPVLDPKTIKKINKINLPK